MKPRPIRFLEVETVLRLHRIAIRDQGGEFGVRDRGLLESAVAMPKQQFGGDFLHPDIPAMAAAYAYHLCANHPFIDGNKRAALAAALAFLVDNGWAFEDDLGDAEATIVMLAAGRLTKEDLTEWVRRHSYEKPSIEFRDLFKALRPEHLAEFEAALDQGVDAEVWATMNEAIEAVPIIGELLDASLRTAQSGRSADRSASAAQALLLIVLFRLAEDMGYEW